MQPQFTPQQRREMIARIRQLPAQLEAAVRDLTPVQLTTHYLAGEWTVAQNVHHLADSHINSFVRLKLILTEDKPTLKPHFFPNSHRCLRKTWPADRIHMRVLVPNRSIY